MMYSIYKAISYVFQPLLMPLLGVVILLQTNYFQYYNHWYHILAIVGTFLFTGLLPALPILIMIKKGQLKDLFISKKEDRLIPYLFSLISYVFWIIFLNLILEFPLKIIILVGGALFSILIILLINIKWKISAHMTSMGALTGGIFGVSYLISTNPIWLFITSLLVSGSVAISRINLKAHTLGQVTMGYTVGFTSVFVPALIIV